MTSDNPSKYLLYQDTMLGMFDYHVQNIDAFTYYHNLAKQLCLCAQHSPAYEKLFTFYQYLAEILSEKANLGLRIKKAYDTGDLSTLEKICGEVIPRLTEKMWKLKWIREELWLQDAKAFGYELLDIKLGGVITRLESHRRRIQSYLDGKVKKLEELEQERKRQIEQQKNKEEEKRERKRANARRFSQKRKEERVRIKAAAEAGDEEAQKQYEEILAKEKARRERDRESNKKSYRKRKEKARAIEEAAKALKEYEKVLEERRKEAERAKKWRDKQKNKAPEPT